MKNSYEKKDYKILIVLLILAVFVSFLTNCQSQSTEQPAKEPAQTRYVDPAEALFPQVSEGYYYHELPSEYKAECAKQGTLELLNYTSLNLDGQEVDDNAYVYLPYGYNQNDIVY